MKGLKVLKVLKVLMIGPSREVKGGVSTVINNYYQGKLDTKVELKYVATMVDKSQLLKLLQFIKAFFLIAGILPRYEILHVHMASRASFYRKSVFVLMAKIYRKKVVLHIHGAEFMVFYNKELSNRKRRYVRKIFNLCDKVIALSAEWKQNLDTIIGEDTSKVIVNSVVVPEKQSPRENHNILFLGRVGARKGVFDLLKGINTLVDKYPDLRLIVGGDGEVETMFQKARFYNIESHIHYVGWVSGKNKEALLKTCSLLVLPSYNEGMPMSVLEGMSYGLPIVSTNVGGIPNIITHGVEGFLIKPGDVDALANYIDKILEEDDLREAMGQAARKRIESGFSINGTIEELVNLYHQVA